ncbi:MULTISPECIES: WXG100 family type VII secretion target [unclassified Arthrobacter]|uniref:WXG100 family type VII secretion target n=1 Tax=unclassified Arthrobacter TaxID=235627 RepID=UPI00030EB4BB|nr:MULTISPECIES: WXG100 family type VII secretion target [unclassified Arthrobacter]PVE19097.1 WXG100 family type VII secretion target [Arthrobacter sp. Bz4]
MANFQVDTDALAAKGSEVQGTIGRLQSEVNTMQAGLLELEMLWKGQAAANFQQAVAQWRATQARVEESLAEINHALTVATQQYADAELSNARMFLY